MRVARTREYEERIGSVERRESERERGSLYS